MNGQTTCTGASSSATVNVVAGQTASASFGVFCPPQTGDITGLIFQDCDCDGVQESGDNGVSGVTVSVAPAAGSTGCSAAESENTDSTGQFNFNGFLACTYTVTVNSAACSSQPTTKSVTVVPGTTVRADFSTPAPTCTVSAPPDVSVSCGESTGDVGSPTVTGGCSVQTSDSDTTQTCDASVCGFTSTFTRTYTVTSQCGGTQTATQRITVGACPQGQCPPCSSTVSFSPVSVPSVSTISRSPNPSRSCRQVCDDGDSSSAAAMYSSFALVIVAI